jgi:hypothetical protein
MFQDTRTPLRAWSKSCVGNVREKNSVFRFIRAFQEAEASSSSDSRTTCKPQTCYGLRDYLLPGQPHLGAISALVKRDPRVPLAGGISWEGH